MLDNPNDQQLPRNDSTLDEGGLRAPPHLKGWRKAWWWFDFIILVKLARLRFIAVLAAIGIIITQWDTLLAYYDRWTRPGDSSAAVKGDVEWFCPMHPSVVRDNAKDKCPICFMPLSKRKKGDVHEEVLPAGIVNRVQLSPYRVVLAGVQTTTVDYLPLTKEITALGFVEFNERGQRQVTARTKGRLDQLFVNETGTMVDAGDLLASLYSPELNVTMQNLLDAKHSKDPQHLESVRTRLRLLGVDDDQTDAVLKADQANSHVKIRSPISGHVIRKYVQEGQYVDEGTPLYDIADLSTVWIQAQVYEDDMAFLPVDQSHKAAASPREGPRVIAVTRAFPDEPFSGKLAFVYPHVDQDTRTVTVRCEVDNPGHKLRPGGTATIRIEVAAKQVQAIAAATAGNAEQAAKLNEGLILAVPETSVIDTGSQTIVYRETAPGMFEGVLVELGPKMNGADQVAFYPILKGVAAGDKVVTAGSFLVDAETRLNPAAGSIYFGGSGGGSKSGSTVTAVRPTTPDDPDAKIVGSLATLSMADRAAAEAQRFCPVLMTSRLGSMGPPLKLTVDGRPVFICCEGCKEQALAKPAETLAQVAKAKQSGPVAANPPALVDEPPPMPVSESAAAALIKPQGADEAKIIAALDKLSPEDRALAVAQKYCIVMSKSRLGSMGVPTKLTLDGKPVFICCEGCRTKAEEDPKGSATKAEELRDISAERAKLSEADRKLVEAQGMCIVMDESPLGSMGVPLKVMVDGKPVFICCEGCRGEALADPKKTLEKLKQLNAASFAK
ncbi:MAG: efflux RND transporter periplasmic adaptor subunit [Planctomycetales bacterium]|nr:efflux RND transporter periplasmic adaptor subunit [Planctomycetales bacterium]